MKKERVLKLDIDQAYEVITKKAKEYSCISQIEVSTKKVFDEFGNYSFPTEIKGNNKIQGTTNLNSIIFDRLK